MTNTDERPAMPVLLRVVGAVVWRLRYDLLAVLIVAAVMTALVDVLPMQSVAPVVPLLGVVVSIFIGFRDTVVVVPNQSVKVAILADNPGYWPLHCHNAYHAEAGMISTFDYLS